MTLYACGLSIAWYMFWIIVGNYLLHFVWVRSVYRYVSKKRFVGLVCKNQATNSWLLMWGEYSQNNTSDIYEITRFHDLCFDGRNNLGVILAIFELNKANIRSIEQHKYLGLNKLDVSYNMATPMWSKDFCTVLMMYCVKVFHTPMIVNIYSNYYLHYGDSYVFTLRFILHINNHHDHLVNLCILVLKY